MQGRSATDGEDQLPKKLAIAERRCVRAGVKGIKFVLDIALTNGHIMELFVQERDGGHTRAKMDKLYTKVSCAVAPRVSVAALRARRVVAALRAPQSLSIVIIRACARDAWLQVQFVRGWTHEVLSNAKSLRCRRPASLCVMQSSGTNSADLLSPASAHVQRMAEHELVDMGAVAKDAEAASSKHRSRRKRVQTQRGVRSMQLRRLQNQEASAPAAPLWGMRQRRRCLLPLAVLFRDAPMPQGRCNAPQLRCHLETRFRGESHVCATVTKATCVSLSRVKC